MSETRDDAEFWAAEIASIRRDMVWLHARMWRWGVLCGVPAFLAGFLLAWGTM